MAGYCVECSLKALILERTPEPKHDEVLATFRGAIAHDVDWLHAQYRRRGGVFPAEMLRYLSLFRAWTTTMRYNPGTIRVRAAQTFLQATKKFYSWTEGTF